MARIRIVDEWLRSPVTSPVRARAVLVVADTWAEQKVLMRAYAASDDQTRPAIVLHGVALAIGPAGIDPHGPWGVHLDDASDGRAQQLRHELELAARRMAGTSGSPPRLVDEESGFDRKRTNMWKPGAPRDRHSQGPLPDTPAEPTPGHAIETPAPNAHAGSQPQPPSAHAPRPAAAPPVYAARPEARTVSPFDPPPAVGSAPPPAPTPTPRPAAPSRSRPTTRRGLPPVATRSYARAHTPVPTMETVGRIVGRTMPLGFRLSELERTVLDRLGRYGRLNSVQVGEIARVENGALYMQSLMSKLSEHGLDIIEPGAPDGGLPTWILRVA